MQARRLQGVVGRECAAGGRDGRGWLWGRRARVQIDGTPEWPSLCLYPVCDGCSHGLVKSICLLCVCMRG